MYNDFFKSLADSASKQLQASANVLEKQAQKQAQDAVQKGIADLTQQASQQLTTTLSSLLPGGGGSAAAVDDGMTAGVGS